MQQQFVQVGITAAREPQTGAFLPSVPIFAEVTPEREKAEASAITDVSKLFAAKMKQYISGGGHIGNASATIE